MAAEWNEHVNKNFYGQDGNYKDNREAIEFKSGRTVYYQKSSAPKKTHAVNLQLADTGTKRIDGKTEFEHFLDWYENTIKSGTIPFYLPDIITGKGEKLYQLKNTPSWKGQQYKEIALTFEEV